VGIDWFTFFAQILNFVILLFLLKRFLYRPVLDAIAQREAHVRDRLDDARRLEEQADLERRRLHEERARLEARRSELLEAAEEEAGARRQELTEEVRRHADKVREDWRDALERQRQTFLRELRRRVGSETYTLAAHVVRDLADADLEEQVIRVFLERIRSMESEDRQDFLSALDEAGGRLEIRTAFTLTAERRRHIEEALSTWAGVDPEMHFETEPDLALGIEMRAGDRKAGWSVGSYLEALQARTRTFLEAEGR
jgi:F-type H+-transporting ATPase subunit b